MEAFFLFFSKWWGSYKKTQHYLQTYAVMIDYDWNKDLTEPAHETVHDIFIIFKPNQSKIHIFGTICSVRVQKKI